MKQTSRSAVSRRGWGTTNSLFASGRSGITQSQLLRQRESSIELLPHSSFVFVQSRTNATGAGHPMDALQFLKKLRDTKQATQQTGDTSTAQAFGGRSSERFSNLGGALPVLNWNKEMDALPKFERDFYKEHPNVSKLTAIEIKQRRDKLDVKVVRGADKCPAPGETFEECGLPSFIVQNLQSNNLVTPTSIQAQAIPAVLSGSDLIGRAETGSGKTLGFLLPACVHIKAQPPHQAGEGPIALVLAPTRELAVQIENEARKFGYISANRRVSTACLYGGSAKAIQVRHCQTAELVIATPGRLIDLLESGATNLKRVTYLVLDEADRMLDMGFEPQIRKIVTQVRPDRQTLMWSATWPKEVAVIANDFLHDPVQINVGHIGLSANPRVTQIVDVVSDDKEKRLKLEEMLSAMLPNGSKVLIFCQTKFKCDLLAQQLGDKGINTLAIHGDKSQADRDRTLKAFKSGQLPVMIATDVAARGLDVKDIHYVINYDFPGEIESYIHRIGRTGRAGATGISYSFITRNEARIVPGLIKVLEQANQEVSSDLKDLARVGGMNSYSSPRGGYQSGGKYGGGGDRSYRGGSSFGSRSGGGSGSSDDSGDGGGRSYRGGFSSFRSRSGGGGDSGDRGGYTESQRWSKRDEQPERNPNVKEFTNTSLWKTLEALKKKED